MQFGNIFLVLKENPPVVKKCIPDLVKLELCRFLCALPLAQMNLRCSLLGGVTASDASEFGGGFCVSKGLSPIEVLVPFEGTSRKSKTIFRS